MNTIRADRSSAADAFPTPSSEKNDLYPGTESDLFHTSIADRLASPELRRFLRLIVLPCHTSAVSPVPTVGKISFTKFTSPEATMAKLAEVVPGQTKAKDVEMILDDNSIEGSVPAQLWNDLIDYNPPASGRAAAGDQVVIDNELLRAARAAEPYRYVLLWAALNLADSRLDAITREVLTNSDGRFDPDSIDRQTLESTLEQRASASPDDDPPRGSKATTNILSLLERCQIIVPRKYGGSIVGVERTLPTRDAAKSVVALVTERLTHQGIQAAAGGEADLALAIGANTWLGLSRQEFLTALVPPMPTSHAQSKRSAIPVELIELATQLRRKRQVVLQGPPGAGKTYIAKKYVAWATAGYIADSRLQAIIDDLPLNERNIPAIAAEIVRRGLAAVWDIVQFHPGYDYTDFVRALAAQPRGTGVTFVAQHRIFSLIAGIGTELDRLGKSIDLILILDEINRGDIPNIFGELLYALEYRGEAVSTPYAIDGDASITVPHSLALIGTMNTADRSIAVIDYALRRRFVFLDLAATANAIHMYRFDSETTRQAALFLADVTRAALADAPSGLKVGPSYFLADADGQDSSTCVLAARYVYEVLPLLTEYEMEGEIDASTLARLRARLGISQADAQTDQTAALVQRLTQLLQTQTTGETIDSSDEPINHLPVSEDQESVSEELPSP
jgi:5-methylcytosine-specific restriction protein B